MHIANVPILHSLSLSISFGTLCVSFPVENACKKHCYRSVVAADYTALGIVLGHRDSKRNKANSRCQQPATCAMETQVSLLCCLFCTRKPFIVSIHHHTMSSNGNNGSNYSSNMYNILYVCGSMRSLPVFISNTPYSLVCLCVYFQQCESQCLCMELVGFRLFVSKCSSTEPSCVYGICSVVSLLHTISNVHSTCYCCWTVIWFGRWLCAEQRSVSATADVAAMFMVCEMLYFQSFPSSPAV